MSVSTVVRGRRGNVLVTGTENMENVEVVAVARLQGREKAPVSAVVRSRRGNAVQAGKESWLHRQERVPVSTVVRSRRGRVVMAGTENKESVKVSSSNLTLAEFPLSNTLSGQLTVREICSRTIVESATGGMRA